MGAALLVAVAACSDAPSTGTSRRAPTATTPASATAVADPVATCSQRISYWAGQLVTPGSDWGLDYQEMGLSDGENAILESLLPQARRVASARGVSAARAYALAAARPGCTAHLASPRTDRGPNAAWPQ